MPSNVFAHSLEVILLQVLLIPYTSHKMPSMLEKILLHTVLIPLRAVEGVRIGGLSKILV